MRGSAAGVPACVATLVAAPAELDIPASIRATLRKKSKVVKEFDFNTPPGPGSKKHTFRKIANKP